MKPIIFLVSILLSIPFSTQLETQIFSTTTTTPQVSTQPDSETHNIIIPGKDALFMEMHHLDSISSLKSLLQQRLQRDIFRTNSLSAKAGKKNGSLNSTVYSGDSQGSGEYFTHLGFGSPPQLMQVVLDTGSDNIWIQCQPCERCYNQSDPLFDPTKSNSSAFVHCGSRRCPTTTTCYQNKNRCPYEISYGDGSHSSGDYMTETLTFQERHVDKILFGCGHDNVGLFVGAAGVLGLGWGNKSFMGQAGRRFSNIFSYCLVNRDSPDKSLLVFGPTAPSGNTVYTPLIKNPDSPTFYYVDLEGISVGGVRVNLPNGVFDMDNSSRGGVIIDSGTSVTRLARPAYIAMRDAFRNGTAHLNRTSGGFSILDTCYDLSGLTSPEVPTLVLHFKGADMSLRASNYLVPVDEDVFCFAFAGTTGGLSIIGNIQQAGFRVSFDLESERLGFTPGSC